MLALLVPIALATPCAAPVSALALTTALDDAERAYRALLHADDEEAAAERFLGAVAAAEAAIPCLGVEVTPTLAARVHRVVGLASFAQADPAAAELAFAAARRADPDALLGASWLTDTDPERLAWDRLDLGLGRATPVAEPARGELRFDGVAGPRPAPWPSVAQWVDEDRLLTRYLAADAALPAYRRRPPVASWGVLGAGVGLVALGAGLGAGAVALHQEACAYERGGACVGWGGRSGAANAALIEGLATGASVVVGLGVGAAVGGGVWVGLAGRPDGGGVAVRGVLR